MHSLADLMCSIDHGKPSNARNGTSKGPSQAELIRHRAIKGARCSRPSCYRQSDAVGFSCITSIDPRAGSGKGPNPRAGPPPTWCQRRTCERNFRNRRNQAQGHRQSRGSLEQIPRAQSNDAAFEEADPKADEFSLRTERGADRSIGRP